MQKKIEAPATWLIVLIASLSILSASNLFCMIVSQPHDSMVIVGLMFMLAIYCLFFLIGVLFWGPLSDRWGRRPCILAGFLIQTLGCLGCYCNTHDYWPLIFWAQQAFGASVGVVLAQAICRDVFQGPALVRVYAILVRVGIAVVTMGVFFGRFFENRWRDMSPLLMVFGGLVGLAVFFLLPETRRAHAHADAWLGVLRQMACDPQMLGLGCLVGICFCMGLIMPLFLDSYRSTAASLGVFLGNLLLSRRWQFTHPSLLILQKGLQRLAINEICFVGVILLTPYLGGFSKNISDVASLFFQVLRSFSIRLVISHALALAPCHYQGSVGAASSLFNLFCCLMVVLIASGLAFLAESPSNQPDIIILRVAGYSFLLILLALGINKSLLARVQA